jgi:hypothetical protein
MTSPFIPPVIETFYEPSAPAIAYHHSTPVDGGSTVVENKRETPYEFFECFYVEPPMASRDLYDTPLAEAYEAKEFGRICEELTMPPLPPSTAEHDEVDYESHCEHDDDAKPAPCPDHDEDATKDAVHEAADHADEDATPLCDTKYSGVDVAREIILHLLSVVLGTEVLSEDAVAEADESIVVDGAEAANGGDLVSQCGRTGRDGCLILLLLVHGLDLCAPPMPLMHDRLAV